MENTYFVGKYELGDKIMKVNSLKIINVGALAIVLVVNYFANALPINGIKTGAVSDKYFNEFAPANITFSIWAVIYTLILGIMIWQFIGKNYLKTNAVKSFSIWFVINCVLNAAWIFAWHYEAFVITLLLMGGILFSLVKLNTVEYHELSPSTPSKWLLQSAFGIYLGWICIATIANFTTFLVSIHFSKWGLSDTFWTGGVIGVGSITAAMLVVRFKNIYIGLAVIWALIGIVIRQEQLHGHFTAISWAALTYGLAVIASLFYGKRS
ncbi:MAG: tryptophan-rich sensory protein [Saprospiraceae bacterium]|nr:tryptophan-rich sensory protein [Saprospiraceae bacterium]